MPLCSVLPNDTFGDRFDLDALPLPRPPCGYAVQMLDTDTLLDQATDEFLPVRSNALHAAFTSFEEAHAAATRWVETHGLNADEHRLIIVPVGYDDILERHILIYGVLCDQPKEFPETYP